MGFDPSTVQLKNSFDPTTVPTSDDKGRFVAKQTRTKTEDDEEEDKPKSWTWEKVKEKPVSAALTPVVSAGDFIASLPEFGMTIAGYAGGAIGEAIHSTVKGTKYNADDVAKYGKWVGQKTFGWLSTLPSTVAKKLGADELVGSAAEPLEKLTEKGVNKLSSTTGMSKVQASMLMDIGMLVTGEAAHVAVKESGIVDKMTKPSREDVGKARDKIEDANRKAQESRQFKQAKPEDTKVDQTTGEIKEPPKAKGILDYTFDDLQGMSLDDIKNIGKEEPPKAGPIKEEPTVAESLMDEGQKESVNKAISKINNIHNRIKTALKDLEDKFSAKAKDIEAYKEERAKIDEKFQKEIVDLSSDQILNKGLRETKIIDDFAKSQGLTKVSPYKNEQLFKDWQEFVKDTIGLSVRKRIADGLDAHFSYETLKELAPSERVREQVWRAIQEKTTESLDGQAKEVHEFYSDLMKEYGKKALDANIIKGMVEDYATRIIDFGDKTPEQVKTILDKLKAYTGKSVPTESKYGKSRSIVDFEDLNKFLDDNGLKFKTTDLAEVFKEYAATMNKALANNEVFTKLKNSKILNDPIFIEVGPDTYVPANYKPIRGAGIHENYAVHPDIYPALKHLIDAGDQNVWFKAVHTLTSAVKRSNIGMSFFHGSSLTMASLMANVPKDVLSNAHDLVTNWKDGMLRDEKTGRLSPEVRQWIEEGGLMFGVSEDTGAGAFKKIAQDADRMVGKVLGKNFGLMEKAGSPAFKIQEALDHATWTVLHDGLKYLTAEKYLEKARIDHPDIPDSVHRQEIGRAVNNIYGGLDWFDAARSSNKALENALMKLYSPEGRRGLQTLMFAPDWTLSTIRAFTGALPKELLKPAEWDLTKGLAGLTKPVTAGDYARRYQMRYAMIALTLANGLNLALSGQPIWKNEDPTTINLGDGRSMAWAKHPSEPLHWMFDFNKTLVNKLGFLPAELIKVGQALHQQDPASKMVADAVQRMLPFSASGLFDEKKDAASVIGGFLGFPIRGSGGEGGNGLVNTLLDKLGMKEEEEPADDDNEDNEE